jgi:hypothetical protein
MALIKNPVANTTKGFALAAVSMAEVMKWIGG